MKYFNLFFILMLATFSCEPTTTVPDLKPVYIHIIDDPSSTRKGAQRLDTLHINRILESFTGTIAEYSLKIRVSHFAMPHPAPVVLEFSATTIEPDPFDPEFKSQQAKVQNENAKNKALIAKFLADCNDEICSFQVSGPSDDYTYIDRHIRSLAGSLSAPVTGLKFAIIQSDFLNSEPGQKDAWIDPQVVKLLNAALSDTTTFCIVISDVDFSTSPLTELSNTTFVASWEDAIAVVEEKLKLNEGLSFHPNFKHN